MTTDKFILLRSIHTERQHYRRRQEMGTEPIHFAALASPLMLMLTLTLCVDILN